MGAGDLPFFILEHVTHSSLEYATPAACESRRVLTQLEAAAAGLHSHHADSGVAEKIVEEPDGVAPSSYAREKKIRQAAFGPQDLFARLFSNDGLKVPHDLRIRVGPKNGAQEVVCRRDVGHPVAHGFVDRILERSAPRIYRGHFCTEQAHAKDVEGLPAHVFGAHVNLALHAEQRRDGGRGDAMLSRAGLGNDAGLPHAPRQKHLSQRVVDFVRARMVQIFSLEIDAAASKILGKAARKGERCRASGVGMKELFELRVERGIPARLFVGFLQFLQRSHESLRDEPSTVETVVTALVRPGQHLRC